MFLQINCRGGVNIVSPKHHIPSTKGYFLLCVYKYRPILGALPRLPLPEDSGATIPIVSGVRHRKEQVCLETFRLLPVFYFNMSPLEAKGTLVCV